MYAFTHFCIFQLTSTCHFFCTGNHCLDNTNIDIWTSPVSRWQWTNISNYGLCLVSFGCCLYLNTCSGSWLCLLQLLSCCHGYESNMFCSDLQEGKYTTQNYLACLIYSESLIVFTCHLSSVLLHKCLYLMIHILLPWNVPL